MLKWMVLSLTAAFVLAACHSATYNQTVSNVADVKLRSSAIWQKTDRDPTVEPSLVIDKGSYIDRSPINIEKDPYWLENHIVVAGDKMPFSYYSNVIANGGDPHLLVKFQNGLDPSTHVSLSYSGTVKGALDLLAAKTGFSYSLHSDRIYWQAYVTRTFDIAFLPGSTDYLMGKSRGNTGANTSQQATSALVSNYTTSDSSNDEFSNLAGRLSVWTDLDNTIHQLLTKNGKVTVSQATSTITVRDRAANVDLISQFIENLNHKMSKQVLVKIQILEVDLQNDYEFGINWQLIVNAFHNSPFVINGNYGTPVSIVPFTPQPIANSQGGVIPNPPPVFGFNPKQSPTGNQIPSYNILLNALNQQGKTSIVSEPRVVCLNNQVSVVKIVKNEGYVASIQNTTLAGSTTGTSISDNTVTSQITPGSVITGLTLYILPKIMKDDIYMQVNADLSVNNGFGSFSGIQLPNISEKHFNQRGVLKTGSTLILAGFRQTANTANANQFLQSQALGGKGSQQINKETIILITPIILNDNMALNGSG